MAPTPNLVMQLTDEPWGLRNITVVDPDGNQLGDMNVQDAMTLAAGLAADQGVAAMAYTLVTGREAFAGRRVATLPGSRGRFPERDAQRSPKGNMA